jgi:hypothetical protein
MVPHQYFIYDVILIVHQVIKTLTNASCIAPQSTTRGQTLAPPNLFRLWSSHHAVASPCSSVARPSTKWWWRVCSRRQLVDGAMPTWLTRRGDRGGVPGSRAVAAPLLRRIKMGGTKIVHVGYYGSFHDLKTRDLGTLGGWCGNTWQRTHKPWWW